MCFVPPTPVVVLYITCKQMMYFILIYVTEHVTPKEQSFGANSEESDVVIAKSQCTELRRGKMKGKAS